MVLKIFPPHKKIEVFMPARIGTFGFARYTSPTLRKTKRANFANAHNDR
ncbi:MAG TPA: hypothetical protein VKY44_09590 [Flavobacterium sp.]|nr:hypothetical protein [Flavobacterium sp.]